MGGNYEKGIYNHLMEVMARLDVMEDSLRNEKRENKEDVERLNKKTDCLTEENRLLKDDNARLRSIINNDSSNSVRQADRRGIPEQHSQKRRQKKKSHPADAGMKSGR